MKYTKAMQARIQYQLVWDFLNKQFISKDPVPCTPSGNRSLSNRAQNELIDKAELKRSRKNKIRLLNSLRCKTTCKH